MYIKISMSWKRNHITIVSARLEMGLIWNLTYFLKIGLKYFWSWLVKFSQLGLEIKEN